VNASTTFALPPTMSGAKITTGTIPLTSIGLATTTMTAPTVTQIGYTEINTTVTGSRENLARRNIMGMTLRGPIGSIWIISFIGTFTINGKGDDYDGGEMVENGPLYYYIGIDNSPTGPFARGYFSGNGKSSASAVYTLKSTNQSITIYMESSISQDYLPNNNFPNPIFTATRIA
jgi:hypothetical protein